MAEGFFVRLFFVGTDHPSINAARVTKHVMEGGHNVPIPRIISRYSRSISNCAVAAAFVDRSYICDNSVEGRVPELLLRTVKGRIAKISREIHNWARPIADPLRHG